MLHRTFCLATILLAILLVSTTANAAPRPDIGENRLDTPLKTSSGIDLQYVVIRRTKLLKAPRFGAPELAFTPAQEPKFLQSVTAYAWSSDKSYCLVRNPKYKDVYGWLPRSAVLIRTSPLHMSGDNPCYYKAVAKNNWRKVGGATIEAVPIYAGPAKTYRKVGKASLFRIMYAYAVADAEDSPNGKYVLVGTDMLVDTDDPAASLRGWINKDYLTVWGNRIGVSYNKKVAGQVQDPVYIYRTLEELQHYMKTGDRGSPIWGDRLQDVPTLTAMDHRFPVLDQGDRQKLIKIAYVGRTKEIGGGELPGGPGKNRQGKVEKVIDKKRNKDIVFLIDATKSMGVYFKAVKEGIRQYEQDLNVQDRSRLWFGVAIYRDYEDIDGGFQFPGKLAAGGEAVGPVLDSLRAFSSPSDHDLPEAVFQGIIRTAKQANWNPGYYHAIVVIGDHGNHDPDPNGYTPDQVEQTLRQTSNPIAFYSINVHRDPATIQFNNMFTSQARSILSLNGELGQNFIIRKQEGTDEYGQTVEQVRKALENISSFSYKVTRGATLLTQGHTMADIQRRFGTVVADYIRSMVKGNKKVIQNWDLSKLTQLCEDGWVSRYARTPDGSQGPPQLVPWVMMERTYFDELVGFLSAIQAQLRRKETANIERAVVNAVRATSGDKKIRNETVADYLVRRLHIPFLGISPLLRHTPRELQHLFTEDRHFRIKFTRHIQKTVMLLHNVQENAKSKVHFDKRRNEWEKTAKVPYDWWVEVNRYLSYVWLPMNYMP